MKWEVVKLSGNKVGKSTPYASVGYGRLSLNAAACELIDDFEKYKYAVLMKPQKSSIPCVGLKFFEEHQENSIKIGKRKYNNSVVKNSCSLDSKQVMSELFGLQGAKNEVARYSVKLDDEDKEILVIYVK